MFYTLIRLLAVVLAVASGAYGFYSGWKVLRRGRQPAPSEEAILAWNEFPMNAWQEGWPEGLYISAHASAIILLFLLFTVDYLRVHPAYGLNVYVLGAGGITGLSYISGVLLSYPFARRAIRPVLTQITPTGVQYGTHLFPWSSYSHYRIFNSSQTIRFYSARSPQIPINGWQFEDPDLYQQAIDHLHPYLPGEPPMRAIPWYRHPLVFAGMVGIITIPFLVAGLILFLIGSPWAMIYDLVATVIMLLLGDALIRNYQLA